MMSPMLPAKCGDLLAILGDQRLRHQFGELGDEDLLRAVAHPGRVVHHQRLGMDALEDMGGGDVVHVEGRILAQEHHVHGREVGAMRLAEREMVALLVAHLHLLDAREHLAAFQRQPVGRVVVRLVPRRCASSDSANVVSPAIETVETWSIWTATLSGIRSLRWSTLGVAGGAQASTARARGANSTPITRQNGAPDRPGAARAAPEQQALFGASSREIDSRRHGRIACRVRVQMVALVEFRLDVAGLCRVDHHLIEVDDAVELAASG